MRSLAESASPFTKRRVDVPLPFQTIFTYHLPTHTHAKLQEIAPAVTAKFDRLDPKPANAVYCPPGYFSANTTGPCEVCGLGYWCPGGYQSTPRRVQVKNTLSEVGRRRERERESTALRRRHGRCRPVYVSTCFPGGRGHDWFCVLSSLFMCTGSTSSTWACHLPPSAPSLDLTPCTPPQCANNATTPTNTSSSAYACGSSKDGNYSIAIINTGDPFTVDEQAAVTAAVKKWTSVIVGDTPGVPGPYTIPANSSCGNASPIVLPGGVDDMLVLVNFAPLPVNGTLGFGGVCYVDAATGTASIGFVNINTNEVPSMIADGILDAVVLHEMAHAQGFGILWSLPGFWNCGPQLPASTGVTPDTFYSCPKARTQFNAVGGTNYTGNKVPLQNTGGDGIWNIHWRESVMDTELMTPYIVTVNGSTAPLSVVTVGQFEDIGHVVNYAAADPYVLPGTTDAAENGEGSAEDSNSPSPQSLPLANDVKPVDIEVVGRGSDGQAVVERVIKAHEMYPKEVMEAWGV